MCKSDGVSLLAIENSQANLLSIMIFVVRVGWRLCVIYNTRCATVTVCVENSRGD